MKVFELNIGTMMLRFYLLMAVVIVSFFIGQPWLSILALPIFLSAIMGVRFSSSMRAKQTAGTRISHVSYGKAARKIAA